MKERPILFSAPMVKAILNGSKTQTRRVVKGLPDDANLITYYGDYIDGEFGNGSAPREALANSLGWFEFEAGDLYPCNDADRIKCPYGQVGDELWVRENGWQRPERTPKMMCEGADAWKKYYYDADGLNEHDVDDFKEWGFKRRPSIHMPRWASRIQLEITGIRVERLNDISEEDAISEGVETLTGGYFRNYKKEWTQHQLTAKSSFLTLWESINGEGSWNANPWVWVVEFKRIRP